MKTRRTALSPIELLVVIVIIVLVPSILMASLEAARELAKIPVCANNLRQIGLAVPLYAESYENSLPWWGYSLSGSPETHPYVVYRDDWTYPNRELKPLRLACLYEAGLVTDPSIFYCPANRIPLYMYESYIIDVFGRTVEWGKRPLNLLINEDHNQWVRVGYFYYPTNPNDPKNYAGAPYDGGHFLVADRMDELDPNIPYLIDVIRHRYSLSHNIRDNPGVNALFKDGHVVYCDDQSVFDEDYWDVWDKKTDSQKLEGGFYYTIFKLIGQLCGPTE